MASTVPHQWNSESRGRTAPSSAVADSAPLAPGTTCWASGLVLMAELGAEHVPSRSADTMHANPARENPTLACANEPVVRCGGWRYVVANVARTLGYAHVPNTQGPGLPVPFFPRR